MKELVGKRLGCLCPNLDECHGNVLIELLHEFFPSESEMRVTFYVISISFSKVKGHHCQIVTFTILKCKMGHLSMFIRCMGGKKLLLWGKDLWPRYPGRERSHKDFQATESLARRNVPQSTEDLVYWMFLFLCEKWDSVPQFRDECFHYMNELYFEATADTFWGCGLDIKTIEQAKQREDFHTKQILGTLTGFNILGWLVKVVSLLKSGGSLLINPKTLKDVSPQRHKGLLLVRKLLLRKVW